MAYKYDGYILQITTHGNILISYYYCNVPVDNCALGKRSKGYDNVQWFYAALYVPNAQFTVVQRKTQHKHHPERFC